MIDSDLCAQLKSHFEFSCLKDDEMHVGGEKGVREEKVGRETHV